MSKLIETAQIIISDRSCDRTAMGKELIKGIRELEEVAEAGKEIIKNSGYGHHAINLDYEEYVKLKIALKKLEEK